jgi:hypothetical protein
MQKEGEKGTIIDQVEEGFYLIEWDDVNLPDSRVEKKHLRLQKGISETYVWEFEENHVADNPPVEYQKPESLACHPKDSTTSTFLTTKILTMTTHLQSLMNNYGQAIGGTSSRI